MSPKAGYRPVRRTVLRCMAVAGAWPLAGTPTWAAALSNPSAPACVLSPAMTEGPFFVDRMLERSDLTTGTANPGVLQGLPFDVVIRLVDVRNGCRPVPGVHVDVWHTDALGRYSGVDGQGGETFCRGYQVSDGDGRVAFRTVYPGWYPGRTIHIHVKARRFDPGRRVTHEFTTQIFFEEALNDAVMALAPYAGRGARRTRNANDGLYRNATRLLAEASLVSSPSPRASAAITLGLDLAG